jgi:putative ABC transport system permease protein
MFYLPLSQDYHPAMVLHLRTALPPEQLVATLRREVSALDTDLPVYAIKPLAEHVTATLTPQRLLAHLTSAFGLLALLLSAIGLYGLLSYSVTERTAEIGVRMAIGARKVDVIRLFVTRGMMLAVWGVAIGLGAAALLMPLIKSALFGVSALDPIALTMAPTALILVALIACFMPARRAANADPKIALRYE